MQNIKNKMHTVLTDLYKQDTVYTFSRSYFYLPDHAFTQPNFHLHPSLLSHPSAPKTGAEKFSK